MRFAIVLVRFRFFFFVIFSSEEAEGTPKYSNTNVAFTKVSYRFVYNLKYEGYVSVRVIHIIIISQHVPCFAKVLQFQIHLFSPITAKCTVL